MSCNCCGADVGTPHARTCRHYNAQPLGSGVQPEDGRVSRLDATETRVLELARRVAALEHAMRAIAEWAEREGVAWVAERLRATRK